MLLAFSLVACGESAKWVEVQSALAYPESPNIRYDRLFFVEYSAHRIVSASIEGADRRFVFQEDGCGPAAFTFLNEEEAVVSCYDSNEVLLLSISPEQWRVRARIKEDAHGNSLPGPNDFAVDDRGGVFFTASGEFDPRTKPGGRLYYLPPGSEAPELLRQGLWYPNGLALSKDRLWMSEHFNNRLLAFRLDADRRILDSPVIVDLPDEIERRKQGFQGDSANDYLGPDGLDFREVSGAGPELFVAHFAGGRILRLRLNPEGFLVQQENLLLPEDLPYPTNVAFYDGALFVTALRDAFSPPYEGVLLRIDLR